MLKASGKTRGMIWAVHGIGIMKGNYRALEYDQNLITHMTMVKKAFDQSGIMNPRKAVHA
jgi:FAD/FMN-containing dehydrogenase